MSDKIQEAMLEQLVKLTGSVERMAHGQKSLDDKVSQLDDKVSQLDDKVSQLDDKVSQLDDKVSQLDDKVSQLDDAVSCVVNSLGQVDEKVNRVEKTVARIEIVHGEKIGALFDAFHLRGDQITELKEHLDGRLDSLQTSINFS